MEPACKPGDCDFLAAHDTFEAEAASYVERDHAHLAIFDTEAVRETPLHRVWNLRR